MNELLKICAVFYILLSIIESYTKASRLKNFEVKLLGHNPSLVQENEICGNECLLKHLNLRPKSALGETQSNLNNINEPDGSKNIAKRIEITMNDVPKKFKPLSMEARGNTRYRRNIESSDSSNSQEDKKPRKTSTSKQDKTSRNIESQEKRKLITKNNVTSRNDHKSNDENARRKIFNDAIFSKDQSTIDEGEIIEYQKDQSIEIVEISDETQKTLETGGKVSKDLTLHDDENTNRESVERNFPKNPFSKMAEIIKETHKVFEEAGNNVKLENDLTSNIDKSRNTRRKTKEFLLQKDSSNENMESGDKAHINQNIRNKAKSEKDMISEDESVKINSTEILKKYSEDSSSSSSDTKESDTEESDSDSSDSLEERITNFKYTDKNTYLNIGSVTNVIRSGVMTHEWNIKKRKTRTKNVSKKMPIQNKKRKELSESKERYKLDEIMLQMKKKYGLMCVMNSHPEYCLVSMEPHMKKNEAFYDQRKSS